MTVIHAEQFFSMQPEKRREAIKKYVAADIFSVESPLFKLLSRAIFKASII